MYRMNPPQLICTVLSKEEKVQRSSLKKKSGGIKNKKISGTLKIDIVQA